MYKIIGANQIEYGPVAAPQLRAWITEGRADANTRAKLDGETEWRPLRQFPEFADLFAPPLPSAGPALPPNPPRDGIPVPNYLVQAILVTLCCCLPLGIVAIVYASQVSGKWEAGDYAGAQAASKNARLWCWISLGLGLLSHGLILLIQLTVGMAGAFKSIQ